MKTPKATFWLAWLIASSLPHNAQDLLSSPQGLAILHAPTGSTTDAVTNGLIAWWTFDDGSGSTATDSMGSYNSTLSGSPSWVSTAVIGGGITSDGSDDKGQFPALEHGTNLSITFWIYPHLQSDNYGAIVGQRTKGLYLMSNGVINFYYAVSHNSTVALQMSNWSHVMLCLTNGNTTFYVSNSACGTATGYAPTQSFTNMLWNTANGEKGRYHLDDLRIYDHALNDDERNALYNYR